jgi:catechol 2,3-dioxygenase-like lactoylglutathione lyase family enzyme
MPETSIAARDPKRSVDRMIQGIDHLNIVVADMARSLKFYTEVLGFTKTREAQLAGEWIERIVGLKGVRAHAVFIEAPGGGPRIELLKYEAPAGATLVGNSRANTIGLRHFALRVGDLATMVAKLRTAGVEVFSDPVRVPGGVVEFEAGATKTLAYFLDPDGVIIELAEYR